MSYENPQQPEGINVSDEHPVRELFVLLAVVSGSAIALIVLLASIASWLVQFVPFSAEQKLAEMIAVDGMFNDDTSNETQLNPDIQARQEYVLRLSERLIELAELDSDMTITVHYSTSDTVNAYAMLGGHVVMFDGLVSKLSSENALAMVLAHEIAHVKLRHPMVATGRGITVSLALGAVFGMTDNAFIGQIVEWLGYSTTLSYSRDQERAADAFAAQLLIEFYGHLNGAEDLFKAFEAAQTESDSEAAIPTFEFLSTHPGTEERIEELRDKAASLGSTGTPIPLPWVEP